MTHAHFLARRKRLLKTIGDGVAIVPTAPEVIRNRDATTRTVSTAISGT